MRIRRAELADASVLAANNFAMAEETEGTALDAATVDAGVRAVFADTRRGFYLLAVEGGRVVGQLMITYEWSDWRNGLFWWIQSVYVPPEARRRGVYRALYTHVLEAAEADAEVCGVRLYVHHDNTRAREVYAAMGMTRTAYGIYERDFVLGH